MKTTTFDLYKLMILYMLGKADHPMTNARISDFMLLKDYASYFSLQTVLSELLESGFIKSETTRNSSFFELSEDGKKALPYFSENLSLTIKEEINSYLKEISIDMIKDMIATASFVKNESGDYTVTLKINEYRSSLLSLSLLIPSEEMANTICRKWESNYEEYYSNIFSMLTTEETPQ